MALLTSLLGTFRRPYPQGNPALAQSGPNYDYLVGGRTNTGVVITDDTATTITAVYRAVQLIASTIAAMPLNVFEEQDGERVKVEYEQEAYLWGRPNPEVSAVTFWETVLGHEVLNGNAYLFVEQNADREPLSLWPIMPERVLPVRDEHGHKGYILDGDNQTVLRDYTNGGEIVHVPGWGRDGLRGLSPVRAMANALGLFKAAEDYASLTFGQGALPGGILSSDQNLDGRQMKAYVDAFDYAHAGAAKSHKTVGLAGGLKWQSVSINPEDSQMLATRQFQVSEVARMFGVPEVMLSAHDKTTSWGTGVQMLMEQFKFTGLGPHMIRFEQTISDDLLRSQETGRYVKFNANAQLRGTPLERTQVYDRMYRLGALSTNDILELEDRPGIGPAGDQRFVPLNMGKLDEDGIPTVAVEG